MSQSMTWTLEKALVVRTMDDGTSGQGAGAHTHLLVGRSGSAGTRRNYTSYVKFTPNWTDVAKIVSATLSLYTDDLSEFGSYDSNDVPRVYVRRLTEAFSEHTNSAGFTSSDFETVARTTSDSRVATMSKVPNGVTNIDVTALVKAWAPATVSGGSGSLATANARNHGFGLYGTTDSNENWGGWSDDHGVPGERPSLTIVYELGPTTPNTPTNMSPSGAVASIAAFQADFDDVRATDTLHTSQVEVYAAGAVKSGASSSTTDAISVTAHGYRVGQQVWFHSLTGGAGLSLTIPYYVRTVVNANSFKVAATPGGTVVNITTSHSALTVASPYWGITKVATETERLNARSNVLPEGLDLLTNTNYQWRIRQKDQEARWSAWTAVLTFSVTNTNPNAPTSLTPNADGVPAAADFADLNGVLFRSNFTDPDAADDFLLAYQIQLSAHASGSGSWDDASQIKWDTGKVYVPAEQTSHETPYGGSDLTAGTWYWRVRHWDQHDGLSNWSYGRIVLTTNFNAEPGTQTSMQFDPNAPWRIRIREMAFNSLAGLTGAITGVAATDLFTTAKAHGLTAGRKVRFSAITGGTGLIVGQDYWVIADGLASKTFKVSATFGGSSVNYTTDVTAATLTGVTTRGPGNVVAILENAKSAGASIVYNSPGEAHFTLPVDHPQLSVIEPKQVHYGIDFYSGDGWRETFAGLVDDMDATDNDIIFKCFDYLALLDAVNDERYVPSDPDRSYTKGGSKYSDVTIRTIVLDQLNRARALANSPVGFITVGSVATMNEKVTIWSTMQPVLSFIAGLLDSHRQGTGKKTRIKVRRTSAGGYEFVVEDAPGLTRDNLRMRYGELVNGYRVVLFGEGWSNVTHGIGRTREGIRVLYKTVNAPGIDQRIWGRFSKAVILDNVSDENDALRRTKQVAIRTSKFGQGLAMALRTLLMKPLDGYDVTDDFPVAIVHGAVNTDRYGSGYYTCWAVAWEGGDDGRFNTILTLSPREDTSSPDADLIPSVNISTQPEWQIGWEPPDPIQATSKYWLDQNTGIVYIRDDDTLAPLTGVTGVAP